MQASIEKTQSLRLSRSAAEAFFRHRRLFLWLTGLVIGATMLYAIFAQRQYQSEMKLLVQNARIYTALTPDHAVVPPPTDVTEQQVNSELELLTSEDVFDRVSDPAWPSIPPSERTPDRTHQHELKITKLRKSTMIQSGRKSNVITITSTASSPRDAFNQLQRLRDAYFQQRKYISRPGGAAAFFDSEATRYLREWTDSNHEMVEFQQRNHLVSVPEAEESIKRELDAVEGEWRTSMTGLAESDQKLRGAALELRQVPQRQPTQQRTLDNQYAIQQMRTLLVQLNNKRTELLTRYAPKDRLVSEVERQIADTGAALQEATERKGEENTSDVNPVWQQLKGSLSLEQVNHDAIAGRIKSLNQHIDDLHLNLARTQDLAGQYNNLKARSDEAQGNYKLFAEKHDQAVMEDAMDAKQLVNVTVAENPTLSFKAFSPRPLRLMLLGTITALALSAITLWLLELTRDTVANAAELESVAAYPVLASLPLRAGLTAVESEEPGVSESQTAGANHYPKLTELLPVLQHMRTASERGSKG